VQNDARGKWFGESLELIWNFAAVTCLKCGSARVLSYTSPCETAWFGEKRRGIEKYSAAHPGRGQPDSMALLN